MNFTATIVIPVWNRLERLGECLASLATHTPETQIILLDLGSERETERRLEQFADVLEDRVLLMHEPLNRGKIAAINRGIASAAADCIVVMSPLTVVTAGWLAPLQRTLQEHHDVGIVCPVISDATGKGRNLRSGPRFTEISQGSFYCQAIRRELFSQIGPFDDGLAGQNWCLQDFSRRAWQAGYRTAQCGGSLVYATPEQLFGSKERRDQGEADSSRIHGERWGETASYCLCLADIAPWWPFLLAGARQGNRYVIITPFANKSFFQDSNRDTHAAITLSPLPRFFPERRGTQMIDALLKANPGLQMVADHPTNQLPAGVSAMPMTQLTELIAARERTLYGRDITREIDHAE